MSDNTTNVLDLTSFGSDELRQMIEQAQAILTEREAQAQGRRTVKIENIWVKPGREGKFALVFSPYHPALVKSAQGLNGKWQSSNSLWRFDIRDEERVREIVRTVFGTDGSTPVEVCDVEMIITGNNGSGAQLFALGREIASRSERDARVKLGYGVTVVSGKFPGSAGSSKYPRLVGSAPVVVLVRDVPAVLADVAAATEPDVYRIA
jgi:hypothetical protein